MADTTDVQGYERKFTNQLAKVREAPIPEADRDAIIEVIQALDADGSRNIGTLGARLNHLRLSSERADTRLVDMDKTDVDGLLFDLRHEYDLAEGTVRNYRKSLRLFFLERGKDWADDITIGASPARSVDPDELLTDSEIDALLEAASNPRDKAAVALLADTGLRVGAIASLRIRDVDLSGQTAFLSINEEANVKDASGRVPLTWSEGHLGSWLDVHPRRDVPEAALIHQEGGYWDGEDDGALSYQYLSRRIKGLADEAGIERERVNTHNFRKTAISRWIREGLSEQAIKHRATWTVDSDQLEIYSGVRDEELNDQILAHYGIADDTSAVEPVVDVCPRCNTSIRADKPFCPGCAAPLTASAADQQASVEDNLFASTAAADDSMDIDEFDAFRERFNNDPEFRARVVGEDHSESSS